MPPDDDRRAAVERDLQWLRAPDEQAAAQRALRVSLAALRERESRPRRRSRLRPALAAVLAALAAAVVLSPAGASVRDWIEEAVTVERERSAPARLPAEGSILTVSGDGAWLARQDGSLRRLGPYRAADFSPRGINVVLAGGRELAAVTADGELRWSLAASGRPLDPAWSPSGLRIAYRVGRQLRLVEGDGNPDRSFRRGVAPVPPAWRPIAGEETRRDVLAWVDSEEDVRVADVVAGGKPLAIGVRGQAERLVWLADGRLAVASTRELAVYTLAGERAASFPLSREGASTAISAAPAGGRLALARRFGIGPRARSELLLFRADRSAERVRELFSGPGPIAGLAFSPDGRWLGFGWPPADSWLFLRPQERTKLLQGIEAIPEVSSRFSQRAGTRAPRGFPEIVAWCC